MSEVEHSLKEALRIGGPENYCWSATQRDDKLVVIASMPPRWQSTMLVLITLCFGVVASVLLWRWFTGILWMIVPIVITAVVLASYLLIAAAMRRYAERRNPWVVWDSAAKVLAIPNAVVELPASAIGMLQLLILPSADSIEGTRAITELNVITKGEPVRRYNLISSGSHKEFEHIGVTLARQVGVPLHVFRRGLLSHTDEIRDYQKGS